MRARLLLCPVNWIFPVNRICPVNWSCTVTIIQNQKKKEKKSKKKPKILETLWVRHQSSVELRLEDARYVALLRSFEPTSLQNFSCYRHMIEWGRFIQNFCLKNNLKINSDFSKKCALVSNKNWQLLWNCKMIKWLCWR